jgi:hypothetical protein
VVDRWVCVEGAKEGGLGGTGGGIDILDLDGNEWKARPRSCLFTLNVCVACCVCCALNIQRKGGACRKGR